MDEIHRGELKFQYIEKKSDLPGGFIRFTKEGIAYETSHLTWGWSTQACNHIFGYSQINTDA